MYLVCSRSFYQEHSSIGDNEVLHLMTSMVDLHWPYPCEVANSIRVSCLTEGIARVELDRKAVRLKSACLPRLHTAIGVTATVLWSARLLWWIKPTSPAFALLPITSRRLHPGHERVSKSTTDLDSRERWFRSRS